MDTELDMIFHLWEEYSDGTDRFEISPFADAPDSAISITQQKLNEKGWADVGEPLVLSHKAALKLSQAIKRLHEFRQDEEST